jgi:hypothetical protein
MEPNEHSPSAPHDDCILLKRNGDMVDLASLRETYSYVESLDVCSLLSKGYVYYALVSYPDDIEKSKRTRVFENKWEMDDGTEQ